METPSVKPTPLCDKKHEQAMADFLSKHERDVIRAAHVPETLVDADTEEGRDVFALAKMGRGSFLHGPCGTGKTTAAAVAARLWTARRINPSPRDKAKFVTERELIDEAMDFRGEHTLTRSARMVGLLVIDDLGVSELSGKVKEVWVPTLTELIDHRVANGLVTVFTSNMRLGELGGMWGGIAGERLVSRIAGACNIRHMGGRDRRIA